MFTYHSVSNSPTKFASESGMERPPLRTLYERDPYLAEPEYREMRDIGCNTDTQTPALANAGCQTDEVLVLAKPHSKSLPTHPADPFPDWLDVALVSTELEQGRESRLRQYVNRFRYSAVNAHAEHHRVFQSHTAAPVTPSLKRRHSLDGLASLSPSLSEGTGKRVCYERQTKIQAKDKIKRYVST